MTYLFNFLDYTDLVCLQQLFETHIINRFGGMIYRLH